MSQEEILALAVTRSDHGQRVFELEPAIDMALNNNLAGPILQIGNGEGGSALLILDKLSKLKLNDRLLELYTVDTNPAPSIIGIWADKLGIFYQHFTCSQEEFVKDEATYVRFLRWSLVYLDADHRYESVVRDMKLLVKNIAKNGILIVDDVDGWETIPELVDVGLERVDYKVDEGPKLGPHGHHVAVWRKL